MRVRPKLVAPEQERCKAKVYVPEQMRHTGRAKSRFERHYVCRQCARWMVVGDFCKQHAKGSAEGAFEAARATKEQP